MKKISRNDFLKLIAAITMLIDHIGAVFFSNIIIFRIIGRIAFPIFAFYIAKGFIRTSNTKKYMLRMIFFAFVTQVPYAFFSNILVGNYFYMNVLFTFVFALLSLYYYNQKNYIISIIIMILPEVASWFTPIEFDYSTYGIVMILVFYIFEEKKLFRNLGVIVVTIIYALFIYVPLDIPFYYSILHPQIYCAFALPLLDLENKLSIKLPKYFFYSFYPAHITIIVLLYYVIY
ncbi:MAG: TraX family protein [Eubacteriaceae bacterium]